MTPHSLLTWLTLHRRLFLCVVANPGYFHYMIFRRDHERMSERLQKGNIPTPGSFFPSKLNLRITYRCNLRCKMCGQWGEKGTYKLYSSEKQRKQLDLEIVSRTIRDLVPRGLRVVDMEGGETFLHPQIMDLLSLLKEHKLILKPVTNGTLLSRFARDIVSLGVDAVVVSLDGDRETHNNIRGTSWAYDRAMEGILALHEEKKRQNKKLPFLQLGYTMSRHNGVGPLRRLLEDLSGQVPLDLFYVRASPIFVPESAGKAYVRLIDSVFGIREGISSWEGFQEDYRDFSAEAEEIARVLREMKKKVFPFYTEVVPRVENRDIPRLYLDYDWTLGRSHCPIPWVEPTLDADGNVYPCGLFTDAPLSMGNVHQEPFLDIWNGRMYDRFRHLLTKQKNGLIPICNRCCQFTEH